MRVIPFKVSTRMWHAPSGQQITTPPAVIEKIKKAFDLWGSVKEAGLVFRYDGQVDKDYTSFAQVPEDGTVYVILNNWDIGQCYDGLSRHFGNIPGSYKGGVSLINTKKGIQTVRADILIHEIGHALGIELHGASPANVMNAAGMSWGISEYFLLSEQDRADLIAKWSPEFPGLYSISGRVNTSLPEQKLDEAKMASVFAVNVENGHAYSAKTTDQDGHFTIFMLKSGDYRVFTKATEPLYYQNPAPQRPSWYVSDGQSTNDPYGGKILHVNKYTHNIKDIVIKMIDQPVPFNLFNAGQTYGKDSPFCFMLPGDQTRFQIQYKGLMSVESYGSHPDYTLSNLELEPTFKETYFVNVAVDSKAEPGERLVIAKGRPGEAVQAGLLGVNVVDAVPQMLSPGALSDMEQQITGKAPPLDPVSAQIEKLKKQGAHLMVYKNGHYEPL